VYNSWNFAYFAASIGRVPPQSLFLLAALGALGALAAPGRMRAAGALAL